MEKTKKKKTPVNVMTKATLAAMMLGTTIGSQYVNAAEPTDNNDNKSSESSKASMPVKVDDSKINKAVDDAKKAGVNVKKDADKKHDVKVSDVDKTQKEIQADYQKQIDKLEKATKDYAPKKAEYDKKKKAYDEARENPKFQGGKTEFSEDQLRKFLGDKPANVTYISGNTGKKDMKYQNGNLKPISKAEFDDFNSKLTDNNAEPYKDIDSDNRIFTKVKKGSTWSYKHALNDGKTGHDVDVKATVQDVVMYDGRSTNEAIAGVNKKSIGVNAYTPIKEIKIKYDYIDSETGKPIKIDALLGKGDLDGDQYYKLNTDMDSVLKGSKVVQKGDQFWAAQGPENFDTNDPSTQVWTISRGVSSQTFTWGSNKYTQGSGNHISDYFVDGAIEFGLDIPPIPKEPAKPKVNYNLHKLNATPENHKDVEKGIQKEDTEATINGEKVEVGDQITYPLTNTDLPADRQDDIKSYVMKDKLPEGVTPDKDAIEKNVDKSKWDVKIDGQNVTVTATKDLLADMNKDKTKAFKVPTVGLVATVTKGGDAGLDNTFDTIINDNTVKSNKVTNTPPPIVKKQAKKTVSTDKIVDFNQKYQYGLDFTIPNDKNYKDVEIKDSDMTKGSLDFDKVVVKQGDKDITDQGELKLDKEKDTFTWKAKDPTKLLGKNIHVDIDAKVKPGTDLSKYKTNEKDKDGNTIYSMPNTGHLVLDGEDTPTNEVPIKVKETPGSIKKSIVDGDKLVDNNKAKFGDEITYNLDAQFANNEKGDDVFVKDQLEKDVLDIQKDKIHVYANDDETSDDAKTTDSDAKSDDSAKDSDANSNDTSKDDSNTKSDDTSKVTDKDGQSADDKAEATDEPAGKSDEVDNNKAASDDNKADTDAKVDNDSKADDSKADANKTLKTGKYEVGKDIDAGSYTAKNNDASDALVITKDKDGKTVTNETIKPDETKDVTLKDGEELSVTAGDKDVSFTSKTGEGAGEAQSDEKDNKATSDEAKSDDTKADSKSEAKPNVKDMKDVTEQGTLKVDEEGESFIWTPKDPSKFKGKKVIVQVGAKFKEDKNGNYKKYEKDGKYVVPNVAELGSGDKDKVKKSNKVTTELTPKKEDKAVPPKKDTPDKPSTPKKDTPNNPSSPKADSPQRNGQGNPEKPTVAQQADLPSTGSNAADGGIIGAIVAAIAGVTGWVINRKRKDNNEQS